MPATDPLVARRCPMCGKDMTDRSADAETCSPECRRERSRVKGLIEGRGAGRYATFAEYDARRRRGVHNAEEAAL
jgi:hypothetical protein